MVMRRILKLMTLAVFLSGAAPAFAVDAGELLKDGNEIRSLIVKKDTGIKKVEFERNRRCAVLVKDDGVEANHDACILAFDLLILRALMEKGMLMVELSGLVLEPRYQVPLIRDVAPWEKLEESERESDKIWAALITIYPRPALLSPKTKVKK